MRLTSFSDYALRLMLYAAERPERLVTIEEAAEWYGISRTHLTKVANLLTRTGFMLAVRGRAGGLRLGRAPQDVRLGDVLRVTEPDFAIVECFGNDEACRISASCRLKGVVGVALAAFLETMDGHTLQDMVGRAPAATVSHTVDLDVPVLREGAAGNLKVS